MNSLLFLVAASALGVDFGWQPLDEGGYEYIIQIEPEALHALQAGEAIRSDIPPFLRDVRSYRVVIGTEPLPRIGTPERTDQEPAETAGDSSATPPLAAGGASPEKNEEAGQGEAGLSPTRRWQPEEEVGAQGEGVPRAGGRPPAAETGAGGAVAIPGYFEPEGEVNHVSGYREESPATGIPEPAGPSGAPENAPASAETPGRPWLPLTLALVGLFASLGGNAYLGWLAWGFRSRCQALMHSRGDRAALDGPLESGADSSGLDDERDAEEDGDVDEHVDEDDDIRALEDEQLETDDR